MNLFDDDDIIYDDEDRDDDLLGGDDYSSASSVEFLDDPFPPENLNPTCLGHEELESLFLELFEKNAMPHAMIFSGLRGIGKTTTAFRLARFLLKHGKGDSNQDALFAAEEIKPDLTSLDVDPADAVFRRIASGGHADLLHITRDTDANGKLSSSLKVEALRKIEPFLRKTSSEGGWRVVLIEDADTMNNAAQNAILKILEEPPKKVLIVLITHRIGKLIPTIRSRSRLFQFKPLNEEHIAQLMSRKIHGLGAVQLSALASISGGSIGQALYYIEEGGVEMLERIMSLLVDAPKWDWKIIHELSSELGSAANDKSYRLFTDIMQWIFRQILFLKARGDMALPAYLQSASLEHILAQSSLQKLTTICDELKNHFERTEYANLDRRDAVRASFLVISQ